MLIHARVLSIKIWKERAGVEHEFTEFTICLCDSLDSEPRPVTIVYTIRIERGPNGDKTAVRVTTDSRPSAPSASTSAAGGIQSGIGQPTPPTTTTQEPPVDAVAAPSQEPASPPPAQPTASGSATLQQKFKGVPALDGIRLGDHKNALRTGCEVVHSVKFANKPPLLIVFCAAEAIARSQPRYHVWKHQCYWFARMLCAVVMGFGIADDHEDQSVIERRKKLRAGYIKVFHIAISVLKDKDPKFEEVADLQKKTRERFDQFWSQVCRQRFFIPRVALTSAFSVAGQGG